MNIEEYNEWLRQHPHEAEGLHIKHQLVIELLFAEVERLGELATTLQRMFEVTREATAERCFDIANSIECKQHCNEDGLVSTAIRREFSL